jgi:cytochrome P450
MIDQLLHSCNDSHGWSKKPDFVLRILSLVTGFGLFSVTGDEHKQMRKAMNPAFSAPNLMAREFLVHESHLVVHSE